MKTYLVTGGAGFIGSHLVDELLLRGHKVVVLDNFSTGKESNLEAHKNNPNLTIFKKDIRYDLADVFCSAKFDGVFHLAGNISIQFSIKEPVQTHSVNVDATLNLLNTCVAFGVKKLIFASSAAIYGNTHEIPSKETSLCQPISPYALHKMIGEQYCRLFSFLYGMETICLRCFNVFGPRQNVNDPYSGVIGKFINGALTEKPLTIFGDGNQTRDFVFVKDVALGYIKAMETENKLCFGHAFNLGSGKNISVNEIAKILTKISDKKTTIIHEPALIEIKDSVADITKIKEMIDWQPTYIFSEALRETYDFFKNAQSITIKHEAPSPLLEIEPLNN